MAILDLPEGEHQYKFLVDGQWTHDPAEVKFALSHSLLIEPSEEEKGAVRLVRERFLLAWVAASA